MASLAHASQSRRIRRTAFTLLELILALALSTVVVLTVVMAIDLYWRQFDVRRTNVEEAQLARAVLRHIADDLRSAMLYTPADLAGLEAVAQNGGLAGAAAAAMGLGDDTSGGAGGGGSGNENGAGQPGGDQSGSGQGDDGQDGSPMGGGSGGADDQGSATGGFTGEGGASGSGTSTGSGSAGATVGLYGSSLELRFDVSRLPRVDQYEAMLAGDGAIDAVQTPSDIKTVTYFLRSEESADAANTPLGSAAPVQGSLTGRGRGLMRTETDRAVAAWSQQSGGMQAATGQPRLIAEEVVGLSFQYFDGTQWLTDWDSDANGGLPLAVEILLVMSDSRPELSESPLSLETNAEGDVPTERTYRLVVHLPTTTIPTVDPMAEATADPEFGASSSTLETMP